MIRSRPIKNNVVSFCQRSAFSSSPRSLTAQLASRWSLASPLHRLSLSLPHYTELRNTKQTDLSAPFPETDPIRSIAAANMPRTFTPSSPPTTAAPIPPSPTPPAVPDPTPSPVSFYTALPLILACQSSPPQWKLIQHYLADTDSAEHIPRLPALHLLLQLATVNHTLADETSPLLDSLLSASTSSAALLQAVNRISRHIQQLAACHRSHAALNKANAELILHFKHRVVLLLTQHHTTLRQQLLDDVTHALLPPASLHPLIRSFYSHVKSGRAGMSEYSQQHSYQSFSQQWTAYAALLLHTPTLATLCQQLKHAHSDVLPALLSTAASPAADGVGQGGGEQVGGVDGSMDVEFVGEYVSEKQLYEWLLQHRQWSDAALSVTEVSDEWQRITEGTHDTIVAWMAQRGRQSVQHVVVEARAVSHG